MYLRVLRAAAFVLVFLTSFRLFAASPTATTSAATLITTTQAQLNGSGVPNGEQTTGWFRISATNPVTCDDSFGTRVPAASGTDLGSGAANVPYGILATGLTSGVTYYFCAIVENASGKAFGGVLSFTVPGAPVVTTSAATNVSSTTATVNGSANPTAAATTGWYRYATTDPGTCNDSFGTRTPTSGGQSLGSGTSPVDYSRALSSLLPGTTYYYCAIAQNTHGTTFGAVLSFTTQPVAPVVSTSGATLVTGSTAQLNGSANPGGAATTGWFRYSTTNPGTCNDSFGSRAPAMGGSALGSGNTAVAFALGITGLSSATTYYYCAIAENSVGMSFGTVQSFTTPAPPVVTTGAASSIQNTSATLQGTGTPNGATTIGYFRYSLTNPGTCNDVFGSRAPLSGGDPLGSSYSPQNYSEPISGLSAGTTYYYCAIAQNSEGLAFGEVLSFTTDDLPETTTSPATLVTATTATLNGSADPNGNTTTGWFRYSTTNPGTCSDSFGTRVPSPSGGTNLGSGSSPVNYAQAISGLLPSTTYYFCAIAQSGLGTTFGAVLSFTTLAQLPSVTTTGASPVTGTGATLNGTANPGGATTSAWFRYAPASPGTCNDSFGTRAPAMGGANLGSGNSSQAFSQAITGLTPGQTYYFCAIAQNSVGTSFGAVQSFTTPLPPTVVTTSASSIQATTANLNGQGVPNGASTIGYFRYSATDPVTCDDTFGTRAPGTGGDALGSSYTAQSFAETITGLSAGTTYYYCAIVQSSEGTAFGEVLSFTTDSEPTTTTVAASNITSSSVTLNGTVNPNGASTTAWFRYHTTNPGTCNNSFGFLLTSQSLGSGSVPVNYASSVSSLLPGTTYYYCAIASNTNGTTFGAVMSFTTLAAAPVVSTGGASAVTSTSAQLNATVNPGGAATLGWFRYDTTSPGTCNDSFGTRAPEMAGQNLGSGTSSQPLAQAISGLTAATTYYYCAIAQNSVGIVFGSVQSFTTPTPPAVTTTAASNLTNVQARLNGTANPNGSATQGWFRYGLTDPGTCDDVFGSRAPTTGGTNLGSGTSNSSFNQTVTGLSPGTTYYFCAIAESLEGKSFGQVLSFTTPTSPVTTTTAATLVASTTATLNGTSNPRGAATTGWFRYSTSNPGLCNDLFGTRTTTPDVSLGSGAVAAPYSRGLTGLTPATTYYYCAISNNAYGTTFGSVMSFTTLPNLPIVSTNTATALTGTGAQLNGSANPGGAVTEGWFRYATASPGTCNDSFGTRAPASGGVNLGSSNTSQSYNQTISGLTAGTTYYYCALASNLAGTAVGTVQQFTTPLPPVVATTAATSITNVSVTLNGVGIANGSSTTGYFRYDTTNPGTCDDVFGSRAPATGGTSLGSGYANANITQNVTGLSPGTTYYYCALAQSAEGTAFGEVLSFTTQNAPFTTTTAATNIAATSVTVNGTSNPNGNSTSGYFRYGTTNPGTCSDSFGTRVPTSGGTALGSGTSNVDFARSITGLNPATTYYYCAASNNQWGTTFGAVMSFTTLANAPTVTTNAATLLTGTGATLNGTSNPGGAATTGYFRYATTSPGTCNDSFGTRAPTSGGSSLGSGTTNQTFSQAITGLTAGTTYYYCAIAQNSVDTSFGSVQQFTTPLPPAVTTNGVTGLTNVQATLTGSGIPNGSATTGWFRYGLTDPGTCDDDFGSRAPATGGTSIGSGYSSGNFQQTVTGLSPGTTYYYCAIAGSAEGTAFGAVLSFTTPTAPEVTTVAASDVTSTTATMNGTADPNGNTTRVYFRYYTSNPGVCTDGSGIRVPNVSTSDTNIGAGTTAVPFSRNLTGLTPGTTYYYCAIAYNAYGTTYGSVLSFTTDPTAPTLTTNAASAVTTTTATLNGSGNPNGSATTGWFRYALASPGACNDSFGTRAPAMGGSSLGAGTSNQSFSQGITGLSPGTTYYYCAIAENAVGKTFGSVLSFTTTAPPAVSTLAATPVTSTTATLNGVVTPNGFSTTGWFRYSTTNPGACDQVFGTATANQSLGSGGAAVPLAQPLTGLTPATTYYFCAIAQSSIGTTLGSVLSFTTPAAPPGVTTVAASDVVNVSATLNATVNPNGGDSTAWFRYSTTNPGTCNDSFGTRAPTTGGTELGSGTTPINVTQPITGLTAGTTYYFCALASSPIGTSVGTILSFTTANAPSVTTTAASSIGSSIATLNGSANPNFANATGWFRYATTNPGTCDDTFGTRAPASDGAPLGAGGTAVSFSQPLTGLTSATTYYYCAIAQNAVGTSFGAVLSFTTAATPVVTTNAATAITNTAATLNGSGNPNLLLSSGWFRYSTVNPGTCSDSFGTRAPGSGGQSLGSGSAPVNFQQNITGLTASTTYYYCAIASNSAGLGFGEVMTFTTAGPPIVTTAAATSVTNNSATLNGAANPNLAAATGFFRYSTTNPGTCNNSFGTRAPGSGGDALGAGSTAVPYDETITGLAAGTTYYYCALATNSAGTGVGTVMSFTTLAAPTVTTSAATTVTDTGATLNGSANPRLSDATGWFRYATTNPGSCNDSFGTRAPAAGGSALGDGNTAVPYSEALSDLNPNTTYYFCAIAQNTIGTSFGSVLSFTTPAAPTATTSAATVITGSSATLNGSGDPNLSAATGYFRYDTTNPGTCDDSFGTRAPETGGTSLGSGTSAVSYSRSISGLASATTYYFCAIVQNAYGTAFGSVLSFTTAAAPSVTTNAATGVTATAATLQGSANPNLLTSTGYFRYSATNPGTCSDSFGTRAPSSSGTALGAGSSPVNYQQNISGLTAGTTYYYCAIATNSAGLGFGEVMSFTTAGPPTVTTVAATSVTTTTATLNGSATPNQLSATGFFRYSATMPASCNNSFGTRAPSSGGTALGSGTAPVSYEQNITGLTPGTTYYYCAIATNSSGTGLGTLMSFTTPAAPVVTSSAASDVTSTGATLNGTANPRFSDATGWFRYSATNPGTCNDSFGTRAPTSGGTSLGDGNTAVPYSEVVTGLNPGTTYYFCAIAQNTAGTSFGAVLTFATPAAPAVTTSPVSALTASSATLNGSANPQLSAATGWFRYSLTNPGTCDDTFGTRTPAAGGTSLGTGGSAVSFSEPIAGLTSSTTYYYCAIAENAVGKSYGAVLSFTTLAAPVVTTTAATAVTGTAATLNGTANPNLAATTGWFRYSVTDPGTCNDSFGTRAPVAGGTSLGAGSAAVPYAQNITGLTAGTTYYFCAIAQNAVGAAFGEVLSFTTPAAPAVTTVAATAVADTTATLEGSANPNLASTTGWFRYSLTNPGTCNDAFGTRAPSSGGANLGAGSSAVDYAEPLTGLTPGMTYYYCAIAQNSLGTSFGAVLTFTTTSAPVVTTSAATGVTDTTAQLNGAANPKLLDATGWFRYGATDPGTCNDSFGTRVPAAGGTALGAGSDDVPYFEPLTDLTPGTTYYFCAIAENAVGLGFGQVLTFTTPAAPAVTTEPAAMVLSTTAVLNGTANPNQASTLGWFRYDTADPGACDDTFGTRAPVAGGNPIGAGSAAVPYAQVLAGLTPATTYYFCAIAENALGTSFGAVLTFTTAGAPVVTTEDAADVTSTEATLSGTANPNFGAATGWFRYDTTDPGECDDAFGTRIPDTGGTDLGAGGSDVPFTEALADLLPGTTYYFCAIAENEAGKAFGELLSFTTPAEPPLVLTTPATAVTSDSAQLNGSVNPNGDLTTAWFRVASTDPGECDDAFGTRIPETGGTDAGDGVTPVAFNEALADLQPGVTYYFCAIAENALGKGFGQVLTFVAGAAPPEVTTLAPAGVGSGATIKGEALPNGSETTAWFRYGEEEPDTCDDSYGKRQPESGGYDLGAGTAPMPFQAALTGLLPNQTYFYCAAASNDAGAAFGEVMSFTTVAAPPKVETTDAAVSDTNEVTLNGTADPQGTDTTAWFRYASKDPGECDDTFGTRVPAEDGTAVGDGRDPVPFTETLTDLDPGTYYFCAVASNKAGVSFGTVQTFEIRDDTEPEPKPEPEPEEPADDGGCGCRTTSSPTGTSASLAVAALFLLAFRRRRRGR